jgi:hypothetical protein
MEGNPLQEAWHLDLAVRTRRSQAQTAALDAQRQRLRGRAQRECRRWHHAMPGAHAWVVDLTAWLLVARGLDAGGDGATPGAPRR